MLHVNVQRLSRGLETGFEKSKIGHCVKQGNSLWCLDETSKDYLMILDMVIGYKDGNLLISSPP